MPSGSRKRKSAKKKHAPAPSSTQGGEDLKHHGVEKSTKDVKNDDVRVEKDGGVRVDGESKKGDSFDEKKVDSSSNGSSSDSENANVIELAEADILISNEPIEVTDTTPVTKLDDSVVECVSVAREGNISELDEKVPVDSGASIDSSITPDVEGNIPVLDEKVPVDSGASIGSSITPDVAKEPTPEDKDDENACLRNVAATSDATESAVNKNEEKTMLSYEAPRVYATEDAEHSQARVTSVIRPDQTTSWKSCCGLFEAFTGTSR